MKNYVSPGEKVAGVAPYDVKSGDGCKINAMFGVASGDASAGDGVTLTRKGVFLLAKTAGQAWDQFQKVYWNDTTRKLTTASSGNDLVGVAAVDALEAATSAKVLLDGVIR